MLLTATALWGQGRRTVEVIKNTGQTNTYDSTVTIYADNVTLRYEPGVPYALPVDVYMQKTFSFLNGANFNLLKYLEYKKDGTITKIVEQNSSEVGSISEYRRVNDTTVRVDRFTSDPKNSLKQQSRIDYFVSGRHKGNITYRFESGSWEKHTYFFQKFDSASRLVYNYLGQYDNNAVLQPQFIESYTHTDRFTAHILNNYNSPFNFIIDSFFYDVQGKAIRQVHLDGQNTGGEINGWVQNFLYRNNIRHGTRYTKLYSKNGINFFHYPGEPWVLDSSDWNGCQLYYAAEAGTQKTILKMKECYSSAVGKSHSFTVELLNGNWDTTYKNTIFADSCGIRSMEIENLKDSTFQNYTQQFDAQCRNIYSRSVLGNNVQEIWYYYEPFAVRLHDRDHHFVLKQYPNPVTDKLELHTDRPISLAAIRIFDRNGRQVMMAYHGLNEHFVLNTSLLSPGFYTYTFSTDFETRTGKFIKSQD